MTDLQLLLAIGIPVTGILTSLAMSVIHVSGLRQDIRGMRRDISAMRSETRSKNGNQIDLLIVGIDQILGQK